jgi:glutathione synthase/RimK-type ligase-like ATP-grasp enzyme
MKIHINHVPGSYSDRWIKYCIESQIPFKIVNCYDSLIVSQLEDCLGLMWHWDLNDYRSLLVARQLTHSLEKKGIKIFPDINTCWHYDDKIGQKYLLETIKAPMVGTHVFYSEIDALQWIETTSFPKVFKLRCGSGSANVKLVENRSRARQLVYQAFRNGFHPVDPIGRLKERIWLLNRDRNLEAAKKVAGGIARLVIKTEIEKYAPIEKGYVYFQDYIPKNVYDTRLIVVGDRCFGLRRYCRSGDFRASGSGLFSYNPGLIDMQMVKLSFDVAKKLGAQSVAFDLLMDSGRPKIIEMSYCYTIDCCDRCHGYWDSNLNWHEGAFEPQRFILDDFVKSLYIHEEKLVYSEN